MQYLCLLLFIRGVVMVTVNTKYGSVTGKTIRTATGVDINTFYAVPYARPPVGPLRFKDPVEPEPWSSPLDARRLGAACPQDPALLINHQHWKNISEDCLHLNIYSPNDTSGAPYPVLFWIHGGAYVFGSNFQNPGHYLAEKGVVIVAPNYRTGALGFLATNDAEVTGNYGLKDLVLALQFVKGSILNIGGDPGKVTIFGQSSGAFSVGLLSVIPAAKGLFHQMLMQSGNDLSDNAVYGAEHNFANYSLQTAAFLGCPVSSSKEMVSCMRTKHFVEILRAPFPKCTPGYYCGPLGPVVDGEFIPDHPVNLRKQGKFTKVPILTGTTADDGSVFPQFWIQEAYLGGFTKEKFRNLLQAYVNIYKSRMKDTGQAVYKALELMYSPWSDLDNLDKNRQKIIDLYTDAFFAVPTLELIQKYYTTGPDVYQYVFNYRSRNTTTPAWMGVAHASDLDYLFGVPQIQRDPAVSQDSQMQLSKQFLQQDVDFSNFIITLWTNFAKFGNPTPTPLQLRFQHQAVTWPKHNPGSSYLLLGNPTEVRTNYKPKELVFWTEYLKLLAPDLFKHQNPHDVTIEPPTCASHANFTNKMANKCFMRF